MWDFENAERRPGVKPSRTIVSVAFAREDFERVAQAARHAQMKLSEFIRNAAVNEAHRQRGRAVISSTSGTLGFTSFTITSQTVTQGRALVKDEDLVATS
jgi:hypothetical protein